MRTCLRPKVPLWLWGRSKRLFIKLSTRNASAGVVILSPSLISNQAPHSRPPPPTEFSFVRVELCGSFLARMTGSQAHLIKSRKCQWVQRAMTVGVTAEGWACKGRRRAYGEGGANVKLGPGSFGEAERTPNMMCVATFVRSYIGWISSRLYESSQEQKIFSIPAA